MVKTSTTTLRPTAAAWQPGPPAPPGPGNALKLGLGVDLQAHVHPPYKLAVLVQAAQAEGLSAARVLAGTGLLPSALADADARTSIGQFVQACGQALALGASDELPFRMGQQMRASSYGMYGFALLTSPTAREAMAFAQRFHNLAAPTCSLRLIEQGAQARWVFGDVLGLAVGSPLQRFLIAFQLALQVSMSRDIWGGVVRPERVALRHSAPADPLLHSRHLGCPVAFDQIEDSAWFDAAALDQPLSLHNPITSSMVVRMCERLLQHSAASGGLARQVVTLLAERPGQFPSMALAAQRLNIAERTLRRRLADEGTSFQRLLDDVRANLAKDYLRSTRLSNEDIATALGFSDAANFRHAFRKWTQQTPAGFRRGGQA